MYQLARLCLILAVALMTYCAVVAVWLGWPGSFVAVAIVGIAAYRMRDRNPLTTLGSAKWADELDLYRAGLLGAGGGIPIGRLIRDRKRKLPGIRKLFDWREDAAQACRECLPGLDRRNRVIWMTRAIHTAIFAPPGAGKGVSIVIPFALSCWLSMVFLDPKGEIWLKTAERRRKRFGHRIVRLDPYNEVGPGSDTFNPLDTIDEQDPQALDHCRDLANAIVVKSPNEHDPHWNNSAEMWIAGVIAVIILHGKRGDNRNLQTVYEYLSRAHLRDIAVKLMCQSTAWDGALASLGGQLQNFTSKELMSVMTTVARQMQFLGTPAVMASTKTSSFDPRELRSGKMSLYLILPPSHQRAMAGLVRLWISSLMKTVITGGAQEKNLVHFVLDEAASLQQMDAVSDALDVGRGYGLRVTLVYQSLSQLKKCFPENQDQTVLGNCTQIFFAVNDNATADYVSARLGESTIIVESGGTSGGTSRQSSQGMHPSVSKGNSHNWSSNWGQQVRRLLKPEEVMALPPRTALTFAAGVAPIASTLVRYYEEPRLGCGGGWFTRAGMACLTLLVAAVFFVASIMGAALLAAQVDEAARYGSVTFQVRQPNQYGIIRHYRRSY